MFNRFNKNIKIYTTEYFNIQDDLLFLTKFKTQLSNWLNWFELNTIFKLGLVSKFSVNYYFDLPLNNQKTRTKKPKKRNLYFQIQLYNSLIRWFNLDKIKISRNFLKFDFINRIWFKYWTDEFFKIRKKRLYVKKITYKNRISINFPILQYKFIIRNFKQVNKKKQKILSSFNLGFFFYEYIFEKQSISKLNKKLFKKKLGKYFIIKKHTFRYDNLVS